MRTGFRAVALVAALSSLASTVDAQSQALPQPSQHSMLDMTFPEIEAAITRTDVVLLPLGSVEEHGAYLPLSTDAVTSVGQLNLVQAYLRAQGTETIVGPPLNIGLTSEGDFTKSGTYQYPGSLTIGIDTFVALYVDVLRSLHDKGLNWAFLFSGHGATSQGVAMARIAEQATRTIDGMHAYALIPSESVAVFGLTPSPWIISLQNFRNFDLLTSMLGSSADPPTATHADGAETSLMLFFRPDMVRPGYEHAQTSTSTVFRNAVRSGNRSDNPSGTGGFPTTKASADVARRILEFRTTSMGDAVMVVLKARK